MRKVIINADDLGWTCGVTKGIIEAHRAGVVTSASLAANMPAAADAVEQLAAAPALGVGLHLNVSQGPLLSRLGAPLAGPDGVMNRSALGVIIACMARPSLLDAVEAEFDAQIRWALDHGLRPTHLDTHRHAHAYAPICARMAVLAQRYRIRYVRRYAERLPGRGWPAATLRQRGVAQALAALGGRNAKRWPALHVTQGTWGIAHTGVLDAQWLRMAAERLPAGVTEIMTHPGVADDLHSGETRLIDSRRVELAALCDPGVRQAFSRPDLELVHYGSL